VNLKGTLQASVADYLVRHPNLPTENVLEPNNKSRVLLFLDGLDEVGMQGTEARQVAQSFVQEVGEALRALNQDERRVLAIIGGRPLVVGDNESRFNRHGKILHLLPYDETQRQDWWVKYGAKKGKNYEDIPKELALEALDELTSQPLLNYLVALSYERDTVDFTRESVRVAVYEDLLKQVHERVWADEGNVHTKGMKYEDFTALLEQVALAAWHGGDTRQAKLGAISKRLDKAGLTECLEALAPKNNDGLLRLLAAFYLGVSGTKLDDPDTEVEFTHKSFGDYLVARHIVGFLELMQGEYERNRSGRVRGAGWDHNKCLDEWIERFGPSAMNFDLLGWTIDTVNYREKYPEGQQSSGVAATWQETIALLLSNVLHQGVPMERVEPRPIYKEEDRQARNIEESLLATLHCCAVVSRERSEVQWPTENFRHASWLARMLDQKWPWDFMVHRRVLSNLELRNTDFIDANLHRAQLLNSNLQESLLCRADLRMANLSGADLSGADLGGADLSEADLSEADLSGADLSGADLSGADNLTTALGWGSIRNFDEAILEPEVRQKLEAIRAQENSTDQDEE
jgi:hypothetical protein